MTSANPKLTCKTRDFRTQKGENELCFLMLQEWKRR